jgi:hypothetical protein
MPTFRWTLSLALIAAMPAAAPVAVSAQASVAPHVELRGAAGQWRIVTDSDLAALPRVEVKASAHEVSGTFSGARLSDLLHLVGMPGGDSLRGQALAQYVLVEAADGYRVAFSIAELSPGFTDKLVLLVDKKDGAALTAGDGPFRLVVPDEKRPARWVRQVMRIIIVAVPKAAAP